METKPIQKACDLYARKFDLENQSFLSNNDNRKLDDDIHRYITIAVKSTPASGLFQNSCIFDSLNHGLHVSIRIEDGITPLYNAYKCLEKYFILLVQQPWKPEYRKLKTYGGFYKTKIKSILSKAEIIFMTAGYDVDQDNTMVYRKSSVDKPQLLLLSFECYFASWLCERIAERHNQLKTVGQTIEDAISDILQKSWPADKERELSFVNKGATEWIEPPEIPRREPMHNGSSNKRSPHKTVIYPSEPSPVYDANIRSQDPEQSLGNFKYKSNVDLFSEEAEHYTKLPRATPEEHRHESLKLVKEQEDSKFDLQKYMTNYTAYTPAPIQSTQQQLLPQWNSNTEYSKDEGMASMNIPTKSAIMSSASYPLTNMTPLRSDQGYGTGQDMPIDAPIHRPPDIVPNPMTIRAPPIPPRTLKPSFNSAGIGGDIVDGRMMATSDNGTTYNQSTKVAIPATVPRGFPAQFEGLNPDNNNLRPPPLMVQMRSRSLKTEPKKLVNDNRVSKSMDYKHESWKCSMCEFLNSSISLNCVQCSFSRFGEQREQQLNKSCPSCTYSNTWDSSICEVCENKLL